MPNIKIMNWNIERLSGNKTGINGIATNIGKIIATAHNQVVGPLSGADIAIILEVSTGTAVAAMTAVSAAANTASQALGGTVNDYTGWLLSYDTTGECYGVIIKNMNSVRPIIVTDGPTGAGGDGVAASLDNLDKNRFATWPAPFLGVGGRPDVYVAPALPVPAIRPDLPLTDVFALGTRGRKRKRFAGQSLATQGGYALGRGFRMPCLAMFEILNDAATATHLLPILTCHLGAMRSSNNANALALGQITQYKLTHIAQKFQDGGYIDLNNAAKAVQELIMMGDFNVDFLKQTDPPALPDALRRRNRLAYNSITPTTVNGGSAAPPAAPGVPAMPPGIPFPVPVGGWPDGRPSNTIPDLTLRAASTSGGTILHHYNAAIVPPTFIALRGACFDGIFFGGTQLSAHCQMLTPGPPADACFVHDVPAQIVNFIPLVLAPAFAQNLLDVSGTYNVYIAPPPGKHDAPAAPNLAAGAAGPLNKNDQLIGARFISDHLPVLIQVNFP